MRNVNVKILNDGRTCIHLLVHDENGPVKTAVDVRVTPAGNLKLGGVVGYIACNPEQNSVLPYFDGRETLICLHSLEAGTVTCPKCMKTEEYKGLLSRLVKQKVE